MAVSKSSKSEIRKDTYNPKLVTYWYEERAHASMRASSLLRTRDQVSFTMAAEQGEDGSVVLGTDVTLGDVGDVSMGGAASGSGDFD